jgi:hypothetical protein
MPNFMQFAGDPGDVTAAGAWAQSAAAELRVRITSIRARIEDLEASAPWGGDEPGQQFLHSYHQASDGGGAPLEAQLKDEMNTAGDTLATWGTNVIAAVADYGGVDAANEQAISDVIDGV